MSGRKDSILSVFDDIRCFEGEFRKAEELAQTRCVLRKLWKYCETKKRLIDACNGLTIHSDFLVPRKDIVEKNISWLTSVSLLSLPKMDFSVDERDPSTGPELECTRDSIRRNMADFTADLWEQDVLIPIPSVIVEHDETSNERRTVDFSEQVLQVGFSNRFVLQHLAEDKGMGTPPGVLEFRLPRMAHVPLGEVLRLRQTLAPEFSRFQRELVGFVRNSAAVDGESKLRDLLGHIDDETRRVTTEFERLDKRRSLEKMGLVYSFGVLSLVLLLPGEVSRSIAAFLGSSSIFNTIKNIRLISLERRVLEDDPFYILYPLTELARQWSR